MVDGVSLDAVVGNIINKAVSDAAIDDGASVGVVVGNSIDKAVSHAISGDGASVGSVDGVLVGGSGGDGSIADGNNSKENAVVDNKISTLDDILEERVRFFNDHVVASSSPPSSLSTADEEAKKSKKDDEAEVPTELWMRWLNEGIRHKISKSEWDEFIPVIQDRFLLLRWRRNLTRSFCQ